MVHIELFGAGAEAVKAFTDYQRHMTQTYEEKDLDNPEFLKREVPGETIEAFRPIYDMYRQTSASAGVEHEPLPSE